MERLVKGACPTRRPVVGRAVAVTVFCLRTSLRDHGCNTCVVVTIRFFVFGIADGDSGGMVSVPGATADGLIALAVAVCEAGVLIMFFSVTDWVPCRATSTNGVVARRCPFVVPVGCGGFGAGEYDAADGDGGRLGGAGEASGEDA